MIFISTGGIRDRSATSVALDFYAHGITQVELSGGLYSESYLQEIKKLPDNLILQVHNYFPPPIKPFVFNLASDVDEVAKLSINLALNAMKIASSLKRSIYSFHAGFRINPSVNELGNRIATRRLTDRKIATEIFIERVRDLAKFAEQLGISLMIENNVITRPNLNSFGEDPLLMTHPDEIIAVMKRMPKNVGLLLDVAHLKVSSYTLGFDLIEAHENLAQWIRGYHLSDNDGLVDSNSPISSASWFWTCILRNLDCYTLEVYGISPPELYNQYLLVKDKLAEIIPRSH